MKIGDVIYSTKVRGGDYATVIDAEVKLKEKDTKVGKKKETGYCRFPNMAGFCRYLGIGIDEFISLSTHFPREFDRLRATLEDEALNASLSPTIIAAYFKKRLGYEKESSAADIGIPEIRFEHDVWEDGE